MMHAIVPHAKRIIGCLVSIVGIVGAVLVWSASPTAASDQRHFLTVYDRGQEIGIMTNAETVDQALAETDIQLSSGDRIEPSRDTKLVSASYNVNVYRVRPIMISDGAATTRVYSAYQTPTQIADDAGITLHDEDVARLQPMTDVAAEGIGLKMTISRATPVALQLYGKTINAYTQAKTVQELLDEKDITLGTDDTVSVSLSAKITAGMKIAIWRNGAQTVTVEKPIKFSTRTVDDHDHEIGYKAVETKGVSGVRSVTYQIVMRNGKEVSRHKIQSVVVKKPVEKVVVVGVKPGPNALTVGKGAQTFVDSKGVSHRETYYDLPMQTAVSTCGGRYTVRADGAKVDQDGYVLVAANFALYPRCSVVETSLGPGKVYDTGGFISHHPQGFDLATDWTNHDGR